jgi:tetratricopeptide (TPR) repeat protein
MKKKEVRIARKIVLGFFLISALSFSFKVAAAGEEKPIPAKIWEEQITLPTYLIGREGKNPRFYFGRVYQGAQGRVYPYAIQERLTDKRVDKTYRAVYLENEYIQTSILPEIGGRIFSALDKQNSYDFIYRQHVIKPGLIGMLGAWITGGVEWNVFHHHRATSFTPIDYALQENPDGSVTAWVGEIEIRHRMKWRIGITLYPGKSYIEATLIPYNRSPFLHSILYFANAGVHTNPDYQVIFPPSTEWVTQHAKREYAAWPIAHETYNRVDFTALGKEYGTDGVDISWWKTNNKQISFFCYNYEDDWMAGYDHGKDTGTCIVGSHHTAPGKKFWTWGSGEKGKVWDKLLTETDGPELELMAGGYSDNEPDYSWIQPMETKSVSHYFYPIRGLGNVKNANIEAAVGLELTQKNTAVIGFNTTSRRDRARVVLKSGDIPIYERNIDISPINPFNQEVPLPLGSNTEDLQLSLLSAEGEEIISYHTAKTSPGAFPGRKYEGNLETGEKTPMPEVVKPPSAPKDMKSVEELYLAGMRLEQFYHPTLDPMPYYEEALRRDPGYSRVNTAVGILYLRKGNFEEAEKHLRAAVERATWNFTHPRDAEPLFYHGLALKFLGRFTEAYTTLYQATWDSGFHSAAYYHLAEIDCRNKAYSQAVAHLDLALSTSILNLKALGLKAAVLRRMGRLDEAVELASRTAAEDRLDFWSRNELQLAQRALGLKSEADKTVQALKKLMRDQVHSYLELAVDYGNCGLWKEAIDVLERLISIKKKGVSTYPLIYYYAGYYALQKGDRDSSQKYFQMAPQMPPDYCFPYQLELIDVLRAAMEKNPHDAMAPYYLGNLLYDLQPAAAIKLWEKSADRGAEFATLYRNLGLGYDRTSNDPERSMSMYEKAVELDPRDTRIIYELDAVYETAQIPPEKRLAFLQKHHETLIADDYLLPLEREIGLYTQLGQYDKALDLMKPYHFRRWEGGANVYTSYVDANLLRSRELLGEGRFEQAIRYLEAADEFPLNLEASKVFAGGRSCEVQYNLGMAYETMGDKEKARRAFERAAAERQYYDRYDVPHFYRGQALKKLGRGAEAQPLFEELIKRGEDTLQAIESDTGVSFFAKFGERDTPEVRKARSHFFIGLGYLGRDDPSRAKSEFEQSVALDINHLWARIMLSELQKNGTKEIEVRSLSDANEEK